MATRQTMLQYRATFEGVQLVAIGNACAGLNKLPQAALVLIKSKLLQAVLFKIYVDKVKKDGESSASCHGCPPFH